MTAPLKTLTTFAASLLGGSQESKTLAQAKKASSDFESVFLTQILNSMSEGLGSDTGFDGGSAEAQWRSLLNEYTARSIADNNSLLGNSVLGELLKAQGA